MTKAKPQTLSRRCKLTWPVAGTRRVMRQNSLARRVSVAAAVYMTAALETVMREILASAAEVSKDTSRFSARTIMLAIHNDDELKMVFNNVHVLHAGVFPSKRREKVGKKKKASKAAKAKAVKAKTLIVEEVAEEEDEE